MDRRQITVLCERGTGEDAGLYRASLYHAGRRLRLVVDRDGMPVGDARQDDQSAGTRPSATEPARSCSPFDGEDQPPSVTVLPHPRTHNGLPATDHASTPQHPTRTRT